MNKLLPTLVILFVFAASIFTYKIFVYLTGLRSEISQTEDELKKVQSTVTKQLRDLSLQDPRVKKLLNRFGGLDKNLEISPEHLTMIATTIEMLQRFENQNKSQAPTSDLSGGISQILQGIEELKGLEQKRKAQPKSKNPGGSSIESLLKPLKTLLAHSNEEDE